MIPLLCLVSTLSPAGFPDEDRPLVRATLVEQSAYTSGIAEDKPVKGWRTTGSGDLWLLQADLAGDKAMVAHDVMRATSTRPDGLLRWQLDKGRYHFVSYGGAAGGGSTFFSTRAGYLNSVPLEAIREATAGREKPEFYPSLYQKYKKEFVAGTFLNPVGREAPFTRGSGAELTTFFDFWGLADNRAEVYVNNQVA